MLLTDILGIRHPLIVAPMFLVSDTSMVKAAIQAGATGAIPAHNYRTGAALTSAIRELKAFNKGPFGINLIVNKSNPRLKEQLRICIEEQVPFLITSLGNPKAVIKQAHAIGSKVFCDVTDLHYGKKVAALGADGLIAVNNQAGGHAGKQSKEELIPALIEATGLPVISAGGVHSSVEVEKAMKLGSAGVSVGTVFIASEEAPVDDSYKQACVRYGANDIVLTTKLSGAPCTVINTPFVKKVGTQENFLERLVHSSRRLKKFAKAILFIRGMKKLRRAAFSTTYETVWCAGPSIQGVKKVRPIAEIISDLFPEK